MDIQYSDTKEIRPESLEQLFASVGWLSAKYPARLSQAMQNSSTVYTAWDGGRLVGLVNAMDDTVLTAYIHYLLVDPAYQGQKIGQRLIEMMKEKYREYLYLLLISEDKPTASFYEKQGFAPHTDALPMAITNDTLGKG